VTEFRSFDNSTCKRVLDPLKPSDLTLGQVVIKRVAGVSALFWEYCGVITLPMMKSCEELIWEAYGWASECDQR